MAHEAASPAAAVSRRAFLALPALLFGAAAVAVTQAPSGPPAGLPALRERVRVGAYLHRAGRPAADPVAPADLAAVEREIGRPFDVVHYFFTWGRNFPEALNANVPSRDLMLSWKPDAAVLRQIPAGGHDSYIDRFATDVKKYRHPVFLRFAWEMNGSWMGYCAASGGPDPTGYIRAWQHLVERFRRAGASNVQFIWCPNESDVPDRDGNRLENYWPGSHWVDLLGFDAYNWSNQLPRRGDGSWRSFSQIVADPYRRLTALDQHKPIWLCEWGTTEAHPPADPPHVSKPDWFAAAGELTEYPNLAALIYFSEHDDRTTHRDWRLDSSSQSLHAFGQALPPSHRHPTRLLSASLEDR